ncbi:MAG: hypothetical protein J1E99_00975 [Muribaculaceae bacterium]|nr:hypothetical protein [Muribaculaceae bacterium]
MKNKDWKGYTMHELQMHRAVNAVRLEIEKEKLIQSMDRVRQTGAGAVGSFLASNFGTIAKGFGIASTAYGIFRKVRSLLR